MATFIVTYDLYKAGQNYDGLIAAIKKFPYYPVLKSAWLIKSTASASQIADALLPLIDTNDLLLVSKIDGFTSYGRLHQAAWDFINK